MTVLGVIPARFDSSRFPGKVLAPLGGRPLFAHVLDAARASTRLTSLVIATDDERVRDAAHALDTRVVLTAATHRSGSDRAAEVVRGMTADIVVNMQADEPFLAPSTIDAVVDALVDDPDADLATPAVPAESAEAVASPHTVTVVRDLDGCALYFSRASLPFHRAPLAAGSWPHLRHVGLYAYRREALLALSVMPPSPLETAEDLEQLRALEHGMRIRVVVVPEHARGVDTPDDLVAAEREWARRETDRAALALADKEST